MTETLELLFLDFVRSDMGKALASAVLVYFAVVYVWPVCQQKADAYLSQFEVESDECDSDSDDRF